MRKPRARAYARKALEAASRTNRRNEHDCARPPPCANAAHTSSNTLTRQRENIAGVEVVTTALGGSSPYLTPTRRFQRALQRLSAGKACLDVVPPFNLITFVSSPA
jgi:hypothetical protein